VTTAAAITIGIRIKIRASGLEEDVKAAVVQWLKQQFFAGGGGGSISCFVIGIPHSTPMGATFNGLCVFAQNNP
jgi:hypothetical protein